MFSCLFLSCFFSRVQIGALVCLFLVPSLIGGSSTTADSVDLIHGTPAEERRYAAFRQQLSESIAERVLPNGARAIACKAGTAREVTVQVLFKVGSREESADEHGLAHLLEHMIFKGTKNTDGSIRMGEGDLWAIANKYGAVLNAYTSFGKTLYHATLDSLNWEVFLTLFADCMQNASFEDEHLASEIKAVIQELRMNLDGPYGQVWFERLKAMLPQSHPYGHPVIGETSCLMGLSSDRLTAFYEKYYCPSRAVIIVAGDIDLTDALDKIEAAFGSIPRRKKLAPLKKTSFEVIEKYTAPREKDFYVDIPDEQLVFGMLFPFPHAISDDIAQALVSFMLADDGPCPLEALVSELKCAKSVGYSMQDLSDFCAYSIVVVPEPGMAEQCQAEVAALLRRVCTTKIPPALFGRVRSTTYAYGVNALSRAGNAASRIVDLMTADCPITRDSAFLNELESPRFDLYEKSIQKWFKPERFTCFHLKPLTPEAKAQKATEHAEHEALYAALLKKFQRKTPLGALKLANEMPAPREFSYTDMPEFEKVTLKNGVEMSVLESSAYPTVTTVITLADARHIQYSCDDYYRGEVLSSMLTQRATLEETNALIAPFIDASASISLNLQVGELSLRSHPDDHGMLLQKLVDLLSNPFWDEVLFSRVCRELTDWHITSKNDYRNVAQLGIYEHLYGKEHLYGDSPERQIAVMQKMQMSDVQAFWEKYVRADQIRVKTWGPLAPAGMLGAITRAFRSFRPGNGSVVLPTVAPLSERSLAAEKHIALGNDQACVVYIQQMPVLSDFEKDVAAIASSILFKVGGSRLWSIRERTGLFYEAGGSCYTFYAGSDRIMRISGTVTGAALERFDEELVKLIEEARRNGVSDEEVAHCRHVELTGIYRNAFGVTPDNKKTIENLKKVTAKDVNAFIQKYLVTEGWSRLVVGGVPANLPHSRLTRKGVSLTINRAFMPRLRKIARFARQHKVPLLSFLTGAFVSYALYAGGKKLANTYKIVAR